MKIFEDQIVNNKAFEHTSVIFTEPWALTNETMLNVYLFFYKHEGKFTPALIILSFLRISGSNYAYDMLIYHF